MLNDIEAPPSGEKVFIRKPDNHFYQWSFDVFRISLTVFELFAENQFDRYRDAPSGENISFESQTPTSY
jgi:hypothetical protein